MIGADTNLLVRFFTHDDAAQLALVEALFDKVRKRQQTVFISSIVVCELCWVLRSVYGFDRRVTHSVVRALLEDSLFAIERSSETERALSAAAQQGADFPDHLIGLIGLESGAVTTYTFDKKTSKTAGFTRLT